MEPAAADRSAGAAPAGTIMAALSVTVMAAFGTMLYALSVLITEEAAGAVFSKTVLSAAYGGSVLVGGGGAFLVGRSADRRGVRGILGVGAVLGGCGLAAFAGATEPWHVMAASWLLIGPAGAMTFYEPAFIAVDQWFGASQRPRALATLTLVGGLAGPIFLPLTASLVSALGWRVTALALGGILAAVGGSAALFVLPRTAPAPAAIHSAGGATVSGLIRDRRFVLFTMAMVLAFGSMQASFFHRIAVFEEGGFAVSAAASWAAVSGILSFPGRYAAPFLSRRGRGVPLQAAALAVMAVSVAFMVDATRSWQLVAHFVLFGIALGALTPLRAVIMADWYSGAGYGRIMGIQWSMAAAAGALLPAAAGALRDFSGSYGLPMGLVALSLAAAGVLTALSGAAGSAARPGSGE